MLDLEADLLWYWLRTRDQSSVFAVALLFLLAATLGATLASLVTWIEGQFARAEE
jgi:hypothetical protein